MPFEIFFSADTEECMAEARAFLKARLPWADACHLHIGIHGDYFEEDK
jgi:hypothetical protein